VLLDQLPRSSRFKARLAGDLTGARWSDVEELLAVLCDRLLGLRWDFQRANSDPKRPPQWKPRPIPRPADAHADVVELETRRRRLQQLRLLAPGGPGLETLGQRQPGGAVETREDA
jgi:hypothetical protein